ncbi:tRNA lysidine(34) synthetase TilS [Aureimonas sp. AU40]|uniref:tRNA lysidine(34) synthetase TilS n=1 Tax=Aureimonas sp. AU40 TaxID=1637747 RepID=UPI0007862627|nr:tRNA lysidine(34) synthetase TilS [Aureimonas sp. AU40]
MDETPDRTGPVDPPGPSARLLHEALTRLPADRASAGLLLAVSGGPDSLALLLAAAELHAAGRLAQVHVATVDHALRPESAAEAAEVARMSDALGLSHTVLTWHRDSPLAGNLPAEARAARYALLAREARRVGAGALLTAHHLDDQIETHLLAKARGAAGPALAAMRPWRDLEPGLVLVRPFLSVRKAALVEAVSGQGIAAVDDPSNRDLRFARARLREELSSHADQTHLLQALEDAEAQRALEDAALAERIERLALAGHLSVSTLGEVELSRSEPIDVSLLSRAVTATGGGAYPPARGALESLAHRVRNESDGTATLGGAQVTWSKTSLHLRREYGRSGPPDLVWPTWASQACFDARFDVEAGAEPIARLVAYGRWGRGPLRHRTLPVGVNEAGALVAAHPALRWKPGETPSPLAVCSRVGWRLCADLATEARTVLTGRPQNAANRGEPVGKGVADTYIRGQVEAACVARREVARAHFQDG